MSDNKMVQCAGRVKGTEQWFTIGLAYMPFKSERGFMEYAMEKMQEKFPDNEYKIIPSTW